MIIQIWFNTDGYLGGWSNPPSKQKLKVIAITQDTINKAKKLGHPLFVDLTNQEVKIFHKSIIGRDGIEIMPLNAKKFDLEIGNIKLKFTESQSFKYLNIAKKAHKNTFKSEHKKLNKDEKMMKELFEVD